MLERGPSSLPDVPKRTDGRKNTSLYSLDFQDSGFKVSGKASGCAIRSSSRFRVAAVHRVLMSVSEMVDQGTGVALEKIGDQHISRIDVVEEGEQIKMQERNTVCVMDLTVDGGIGRRVFASPNQTCKSGYVCSSVVLCGWSEST